VIEEPAVAAGPVAAAGGPFDRITPGQAGEAVASAPGRLKVSREKLLCFYPDFFSPLGVVKRHLLGHWEGVPYGVGLSSIAEHLDVGDSNAAVVISTSPLLVAAFTDEFDCIALLKFPDKFARLEKLDVGSRVLTSNAYMTGPKKPVRDLLVGPQATGRWHNVIPWIAHFLSDDTERMAELKRAIQPGLWKRTAELGAAFVKQHPGKARNGAPFLSHLPCITTWA
jgi:hypothetical protein